MHSLLKVKMKAFLNSFLVAILALSVIVSSAPSVEQNGANEAFNAVAKVEDSQLQNLTKIWKEYMTLAHRVLRCSLAEGVEQPVIPLHYPELRVNISNELFNVQGSIKNLVLGGFESFLLIGLDADTSSNRINYDMLYNNIQILGEFDLVIGTNFSGYEFFQNLKGLINLQLSNLRSSGGVTIGQNENGGVQVSNIESNILLGDINSFGLNKNWDVSVNNFVNQYIRDSVRLFLQLKREQMSQIYAAYVTPLVNSALYNVTLNDLTESFSNYTTTLKKMNC